jgi:hypothetical protein
MPVMKSSEYLLTERAAAQRLGVAYRTLRGWRWAGVGPPWVRLPHGWVRYPVVDLAAWIDSRLVSALPDVEQGPVRQV